MSNFESVTTVMTIASVQKRLRGTTVHIIRRRVQFGISTAWRNGLWPLELPNGLGTHTTHSPVRRMS